MTKPKTHDLSALASNALHEIEHAQNRRAILKQRSPRPYPWFWISSAVLVALVITLVASDAHFKRFWLGVSERQQLAEITAVLSAAKAAVDGSQSITGEWPSRVPLPTLAALVEMKNPGPQYRLLAKTEHWQLTMTPSGDLQKDPL